MAMLGRVPSVGKRVPCGTFFMAALLLVSAAAFSQDQPNPKVDIFGGYQWLNPGATVPAPGNPSNSPVPLNLKGMGKGLGGAVAYNFDRHFGLEGDLGHNWGDQGYE